MGKFTNRELFNGCCIAGGVGYNFVWPLCRKRQEEKKKKREEGLFHEGKV